MYVALTVVAMVAAGIPCYWLGRLVGEERGRMDAYRKVADLNRRLNERGMRR